MTDLLILFAQRGAHTVIGTCVIGSSIQFLIRILCDIIIQYVYKYIDVFVLGVINITLGLYTIIVIYCGFKFTNYGFKIICAFNCFLKLFIMQ